MIKDMPFAKFWLCNNRKVWWETAILKVWRETNKRRWYMIYVDFKIKIIWKFQKIKKYNFFKNSKN